MSGPISVKWTSGDTFRASLSIDDLFDPTMGFIPVYGEIHAKLKAATHVTKAHAAWDDVAFDSRVQIRLSGSKEYVPLTAAHRRPTIASGRARLRITGAPINVPAPLIDTKLPEIAPSLGKSITAGEEPLSDLIEAFMGAGCYTSQSNSEAAAKVAAKVLDARKAPTKMEASSQTDQKKTHAVSSQTSSNNGDATRSSRLNGQDNLSDGPESFVTQSEVLALIEAKIADFASTRETREPHGHHAHHGPRSVNAPYEQHRRHGHHHHHHDHHSSEFGSRAATHGSGRGRMLSDMQYRHNAICDACDKYILGTRYKCLDCPDYDSCDTCWIGARRVHSSHRFVKITDDSLIPPLSSKTTQVHSGVLCDGPTCTMRKTPISGDRYKCAICPDFDLCATCEVSPKMSHDRTHPMIKIKTPIAHVSVAVELDEGKRGPSPAPEKVEQQVTHTVDEPLAERLATAGLLNASRQFVPPSTELKETFASIGARVRHALSSSEAASLFAVRHLTVACDECNQMVRGSRYMCATCKDFDLCQACFLGKEHPANHVFVRYNKFVNNIITPRLRIDAVTAPAISGLHKGFFCNECEQSPIVGPRYHCMECEDYDACENCKDVSRSRCTLSSKGTHLRDHTMQIIPSYQQSSKASSESSPVTASKHSVPEELAEAKSVHEKLQTPEAPINTATAAGKNQSNSEASRVLSAEFVEDVSIPDGTVVTQDASFVKQWLVRNNGTVEWPAGVKAVSVGGAELTVSDPLAQQKDWSATGLEASILPGQCAVISVLLKAPAVEKNNVVSYFKLSTPVGMKFGCRLWVDVDVQARPLSLDEAGASQKNKEIISEIQHLENVDLSESKAPETEQPDLARPSTSSSDGTSQSVMIFPSASMELARPGPFSNDSVSVAGTQLEEQWGSEDEVTLSDDDDYDVLDDQSSDGY